MAYFDPFCPILTDLLFLDWILWWETKAIWKKLSILFDDKFPEFSFGKIRFLIGFHVPNLWAFAVSFPNGASTYVLHFAQKTEMYLHFKEAASVSNWYLKPRLHKKCNPTIQTPLTYLRTWHSFSSLKLGVSNHFPVGPKIDMQWILHLLLIGRAI